MSYILDALKKSEQERGHGNIPSVQTVHTSSLNYKNKKAVWPYFLIAVIALNLAAIVYFYLDKNETPASVTAEKPSDREDTQGNAANNNSLDDKAGSQLNIATPVAHETVTPPEHDSPPVTTREITPAPPVNTATGNTIDVYSQPAADERWEAQADNSEVIEFHDLPESIKRQLPTIVVSAHVYSSNPLQRSIVINNDFLEEGEYVLDGLVLEEITEDGAILIYQGTRFHYDVVSGWR